MEYVVHQSKKCVLKKLECYKPTLFVMKGYY
jgi:hypothetical protein